MEFAQASVPVIFETICRLAREHDPLHEGIEIELTSATRACPRLIALTQENKTLRDLILVIGCIANLDCELTGKGVQIHTML